MSQDNKPNKDQATTAGTKNLNEEQLKAQAEKNALHAEELEKQKEALEAEQKRLKEFAETLQLQADKAEEAKVSAAEQPVLEEDKEPIEGSVKKSYSVPAGEEGMVHYVLTDYAAPRPKNLSKDFKPPKRVVKTAPEMFVRQFGENFSGSDAFANVITPGQILRIHMNLKNEHVEKAYADDIHSATGGKPSAKAEWIKKMLDKKQDLRLVGGNQIVKKGDVLHIPTNDPKFDFDPADIKKFPEECMH